MAEPEDTTLASARWSSSSRSVDDGPISTRRTRHRADNDYAKGELKAMIERGSATTSCARASSTCCARCGSEGLLGRALAALGGSSRIGLRAARRRDARPARARTLSEDRRDRAADGRRRLSEHAAARTRVLQRADPAGAAGLQQAQASGDRRSSRGRVRTPSGDAAGRGSGPCRSCRTCADDAQRRRRRSGSMPQAEAFGEAFAVAGSEVAHDPELDEAGARSPTPTSSSASRPLGLTGPGGARSQAAETWLILFDLYRATGQQHKFESLAIDYAQQFELVAPEWFSLPRWSPRRRATAAERSRPRAGRLGLPALPRRRGRRRAGVARLQMPLPWVLDWGALQAIDAEACRRLRALSQLDAAAT